MGTTVTNIYNANATTKASAEDFWKKKHHKCVAL